MILRVNESLLTELAVPLNEWTQETQVGNIFIKMVEISCEFLTCKHPFFKTYQIYCNNYESALQKLEECKKRNSVNNFLKQNEEGARTLISLLITPVQR